MELSLVHNKVRKVKSVKLIAYIVVALLFSLVPILTQSSYYMHILILSFIYIIVSVSFRLIAISGQFPLAHIAFMGIGAYTSAILAKQLGWSPWVTIIIGASLAMIVGILIGYPFARLRALYYALVSLFFGVGVIQVINALGRWTGGNGGLVRIPGIPGLIGPNKVPYYYFILGLTVVCLIANYRIESCRIGVNFKAINQSHLVASSIGINEARYRVLALAVGCFFAGLAGAIYAHYNLVLSPLSFNMGATLWIVMYVLIGGVGSFVGPIIGTLILFLVPQFYRSLQSYVPYVSAVLMALVVFIAPEGIVSLPQLIKLRMATLWKRKGKSHAA